MKRVLIFSTTYFPLVGGAEISMKEVTDRLPNRQFDLICARIQPGLVRQERIGNVTVHRVGFGKPVDKYLLPMFGVWRALRLVKAKDIAVIWSLLASYGGFAALVYTWIRPHTKLLLTLQEGDPLEHYAKRVGRLKFLHKKIFARANAVQAISTFLAEWSVKMGFKGTPTIVPNGVDLRRFVQTISLDRRRALRQKLGLSDGDVALVTASRLSLKNGVDDLIRALTFLPPHVKALIAGSGEDEDKLKALTRQKNLESRTLFLGALNHDELPELFQLADVFVRASLSEALGNAFLEAMACGLPIIGTPVGGIPDFLTDGETGVFCQPRDPESIAQAVQRILSEDGFRERLIEQGTALVKEKYGWDGIAHRIGQILSALS